MRVAIINDMLWGGGRERRITQLVKGLIAKGVDVHLILLDSRIDYPEVAQLGAEITVIERNRKDLSVFPKLAKVLRDSRPDVVNAWSYLSSVYAGVACARLRIPFVSSFIADCVAPRFASLEYIAKWLTFALAKKVVSNTKLAHDVYGTPARKRVVIYNGFDDERLRKVVSKAQILEEFGLPQDAPVLTMAARFEREKDFATFIDACRHLRKRGRWFVAFCLGQGAMLPMVRSLVLDEERECIRFPGFRVDAESFIAASDVGVLCTNDEFHREGISNALLEFMAFGKPVVATCGGGTGELIASGVTGYLVGPKDSVELADRLDHLLTHHCVREEMGLAARADVLERFALDRMTHEFLELYEAAAC